MRFKQATFIGLILFWVGHSAGAETARGIVFDDRDRNGTYDNGETGIGGVAVSNGEEVVLTDDSGRYELDVEAGEVLFFSKPRGYALPVRQDNIPQFFFPYFPDGTSPNLGFYYAGMEPTGSLPDEINFAVHEVAEPEDFNVIWTSDPQVRTHEELDFVRDDVITELVGEDAAFGLTTGDIMFDDLSLFQRYAEIYGQIGVPWFNVPGNHDMNFHAPEDVRSLDTFTRYFGPRYYSFNWGQTHFIVLDDIYYAGSDPENPTGFGGYEARIDDRQLDWLRNDLSVVPRENLVVLAMHSPFRSVASPDDTTTNVQNLPDVLALLEDFENVFAVAGHLHTTEHYYFTPDDGWNGDASFHQHTIATVSGSWWLGDKDDRGIPYTVQMDGTPNGYHIMTVEGTSFSMRYKAAGQPDDYQMRIMLQTGAGNTLVSNLLSSQLGSVHVLINLFDGGPNTQVDFQIDGGTNFPTERVLRREPFAQTSYGPPYVYAPMMEARSTHLWTARLPDQLAPGAHTLTVRATDEYGQIHTGQKIFEISSQ